MKQKFQNPNILKHFFQPLQFIDLNQLSEKLKRTREEKNLNRSQMAFALGISSQLYGQYEDGKRVPKMPFFVKWKEKFNQDLAETNVSNQVNEPPANYDSRRTLENTIEKMAEDKLRSTTIIERLVTLLERSINSGEPMKAGQVPSDPSTIGAIPTEHQNLSLGKKYKKVTGNQSSRDR